MQSICNCCTVSRGRKPGVCEGSQGKKGSEKGHKGLDGSERVSRVKKGQTGVNPSCIGSEMLAESKRLAKDRTRVKKGRTVH